MRHTNLIPISAKLVLILDSILLNRLTYCQQVWHYCKASDSRKIERLQERGLGVVYKDQQGSPTETSDILIVEISLNTQFSTFTSAFISVFLPVNQSER